MTNFGYVTPEKYAQSFTPASIDAFRKRCSRAVARSAADGNDPPEVVVDEIASHEPVRFLGFRTNRVRTQVRREVQLRGWMLASVVTLMGHDGDEWYRWTVSAVLGEDGRLYRMERHEEQRSGRPTSDDGKTRIELLKDSEMDRWDHMDPQAYLEAPAPGYWSRFPGALERGLERALRDSAAQ